MSAAAALKRTPARPVKPADETNDWFLDVVRAERDALDAFIASAPAGIDAIVRLIAGQTRPIVCLGMGKSGLVAAKLAATFSSLGTPAFFLNAAEAAHGEVAGAAAGAATGGPATGQGEPPVESAHEAAEEAAEVLAEGLGIEAPLPSDVTGEIAPIDLPHHPHRRRRGEEA